MPKSLVFIGDSLTEWFDWQKRFPDYTVSNLGISGEPVEGLLDRRDAIRARVDNPSFIFLMTGINNILMGHDDIVGPYREIVRNFTTWYKKTKVVIQSLLPVDPSWTGHAVIVEMNGRLEEIARDFKAAYLDVFRHFVDSRGNLNWEYLQEDGVHLTQKGYEAWAKQVDIFLGRQLDRKSPTP